MDKCIIIIDNSNIWIEGQKLSAYKKGQIKSSPSEKDICDPSWRYDFGKALTSISEGKQILKAILVGSRPPAHDSVWTSAKAHGFEVFVHDRNSAGKEKSVDTEIVAQGTEFICSQSEPAILKLVSGDRDFIPLIKVAERRGWETEMWAFTNAFSVKGEMAQTVARVKPLNTIFDEIGHCAFEWPIP
jgi:uncharacterized LabA/DUF88 family protein